ncbi:MAG: hypothetical protein M3Z37_02375 [Candidatus Eremiobacteraeota bacterium]|nr:hypothetical protein [Candidatus Eremiobacteraeota bacterium]
MCILCHHDATQSQLFVSLQRDPQPRYKICSTCSLLALRQGLVVVYRATAAA